jgi:hypothetical protein
MESEIREVMSRVSDVLEIAESRELDVRMFRRTHKERTNCMIKALREYNGLFRFFSEIDRPPIRKTV